MVFLYNFVANTRKSTKTKSPRNLIRILEGGQRDTRSLWWEEFVLKQLWCYCWPTAWQRRKQNTASLPT